MLIGRKYRLKPTPQQETFFNQTIGSTRFVYNQLLGDYKNQIENGVKPVIKGYCTLKPLYPWLGDSDSRALCNARTNLDKALKNFFDSRTGKRKGGKMGFPQFKSKGTSKWSYTTDNQGGNIRIENSYIKLPKVGWVKILLHRPFKGEIRTCTITKRRNGKYEVSISCEVAVQPKHKIKNINSLRVVGLDLSYSSFAVDSEELSDDTKAKYVRQYRINERKTKRLSRRVSKKQLKGKNRYKARQRLASHAEYVANCRRDFCHKQSRYYVDNYDVIVLEDINLAHQAKTKMRGHSKSVLDLGFGQFREFLKYKSVGSNSVVLLADKYFASSQTCSVCGEKNPKVKDLSVREWICDYCGTTHDRDKNAAINLKELFCKTLKNTCGRQEIYAWGNETSTLREILGHVLSMNQEKFRLAA